MIEGKNIREVFDFRLSIASVFIDRRNGTWQCVIVSKNNPDHVEGAKPTPPLEIHDTGIKVIKGDLKVPPHWLELILVITRKASSLTLCSPSIVAL